MGVDAIQGARGSGILHRALPIGTRRPEGFPERKVPRPEEPLCFVFRPGRAADKADRKNHQPRREGRGIFHQGQVRGMGAAKIRGIRAFRAHLARHQQHRPTAHAQGSLGKRDLARLARHHRPDRTKSGGMGGSGHARSHARTTGLAYRAGQGNAGFRGTPPRTAGTASPDSPRGQVRRSHGQPQRALRGLSLYRLGGFRQSLRERELGLATIPDHHADRALRQRRRPFRRHAANQHHLDRLLPRRVDVHLDGLLQATDKERGSGFFRHAAQGQSHRL